MQLSDWLNEHLDFDGGEDFGKLAEVEPTEEDELCKTSAESVARWLDYMSALIEGTDNASVVMQDKARLMRNLAAKLRRQIEKKK